MFTKIEVEKYFQMIIMCSYITGITHSLFMSMSVICQITITHVCVTRDYHLADDSSDTSNSVLFTKKEMPQLDFPVCYRRM